MPPSARLVLNIAGLLISFGGLYDLFSPRLPPNLASICGKNESARKLTRELLRALGGSLVAVGASVLFLINVSTPYFGHRRLFLILLLVVPSEGVNALAMRRVGSPFYFPLAFLLLTILGVALAWPSST